MDSNSDSGLVVILALLAIALTTSLVTALVLATTVETTVAATFRGTAETLYAADAGLERAMIDLPVADWNAVLNGAWPPAFSDGAFGGTRILADGAPLDLTAVLNQANCEKVTTCSQADMDRVTAERPWGADNPRWRLYGFGRMADLAGRPLDSPFYIVVLVGDDPLENDGNHAQDGASATNDGSGTLTLQAEAFGPRGAHRLLQATVARIGDSAQGVATRVLSWRIVR